VMILAILTVTTVTSLYTRRRAELSRT
jgi:hypothetical protein